MQALHASCRSDGLNQGAMYTISFMYNIKLSNTTRRQQHRIGQRYIYTCLQVDPMHDETLEIRYRSLGI